jgi:hypothetical protein
MNERTPASEYGTRIMSKQSMLNRRRGRISRRGLLATGASIAAATMAGELPAQTALAAAPGNAPTFSSGELRERTIERRSVEAAVWGMPIVSFDAMRLSFPKIPSGLDSRIGAESSHHETRCLRSFMPLEWLLPTCSSRAPD